MTLSKGDKSGPKMNSSKKNMTLKKRKSTTEELPEKGRTEKRKVVTLSKGDKSGAKMTSPKKQKTRGKYTTIECSNKTDCVGDFRTDFIEIGWHDVLTSSLPQSVLDDDTVKWFCETCQSCEFGGAAASGSASAAPSNPAAAAAAAPPDVSGTVSGSSSSALVAASGSASASNIAAAAAAPPDVSGTASGSSSSESADESAEVVAQAGPPPPVLSFNASQLKDLKSYIGHILIENVSVDPAAPKKSLNDWSSKGYSSMNPYLNREKTKGFLLSKQPHSTVYISENDENVVKLANIDDADSLKEFAFVKNNLLRQNTDLSRHCAHFTRIEKFSNFSLVALEMKKYSQTMKTFLSANRGDSISMKKRLEFCKDFCECLDALHQHGYFHGDLKLDNILLDDELKMVLSDFGKTQAFDTKNKCKGKTLGTHQRNSLHRPNVFYQEGAVLTKSVDMYGAARCIIQLLDIQDDRLFTSEFFQVKVKPGKFEEGLKSHGQSCPCLELSEWKFLYAIIADCYMEKESREENFLSALRGGIMSLLVDREKQFVKVSHMTEHCGIRVCQATQAAEDDSLISRNGFKLASTELCPYLLANLRDDRKLIFWLHRKENGKLPFSFEIFASSQLKRRGEAGNFGVFKVNEGSVAQIGGRALELLLSNDLFIFIKGTSDTIKNVKLCWSILSENGVAINDSGV